MLSIQQQRSVLSRFHMEYNYGSWDPNSRTWGGRFVKAHCSHCPATEEKIGGRSTRYKSTWTHTFDDATRMYPVNPNWSHASEELARMQVLYEHLQEKHNVSPCKICGVCMTSRGMTRHQKSPECQGELRRYEMSQEGFVNLDSYPALMIPEIMERKKEELEKMVDWRDHLAYVHLERAADDAARWFVEKLDIRTAYSAWKKETRSYEKELWAPPTVQAFLSIVSENTYKPSGAADESVLNILNQWIDGNAEQRDAILGILELQAEGGNS